MPFRNLYKNILHVVTFFIPLQKYIVWCMKVKKVLFVNQEVTPYVPESSMSIIGKKLPQAMQEKGCEIRTFMPKWGGINERRGQLHEVIRLSRMMLIINDTDHPLIIKVASIPSTRLQVYFIDNEDYFSKEQTAANAGKSGNDDNGERVVFFARGVLETVKKLRWTPDIIHCQGWMSVIVPLYVKTAYHDEPAFADAKVVTSLFDNSLETSFGKDFAKTADYRSAKAKLLSKYGDFGYNDLCKLAIDYSDGIIQENEGISAELKDYIAEKQIPVMTKSDGQDIANVYGAFYDQIIG